MKFLTSFLCKPKRYFADYHPGNTVFDADFFIHEVALKQGEGIFDRVHHFEVTLDNLVDSAREFTRHYCRCVSKNKHIAHIVNDLELQTGAMLAGRALFLREIALRISRAERQVEALIASAESFVCRHVCNQQCASQCQHDVWQCNHECGRMDLYQLHRAFNALVDADSVFHFHVDHQASDPVLPFIQLFPAVRQENELYVLTEYRIEVAHAVLEAAELFLLKKIMDANAAFSNSAGYERHDRLLAQLTQKHLISERRYYQLHRGRTQHRVQERPRFNTYKEVDRVMKMSFNTSLNSILCYPRLGETAPVAVATSNDVID